MDRPRRRRSPAAITSRSSSARSSRRWRRAWARSCSATGNPRPQPNSPRPSASPRLAARSRSATRMPRSKSHDAQGCRRSRSTILSKDFRSARNAIPTRSRSSAATPATAARFASRWFVAKRSCVATAGLTPRLIARSYALRSAPPSASYTSTGCTNIGRYAFPDASRYGSPITPGTVAAMPLTRKAVTFVFCHTARSLRRTTPSFVSNRMLGRHAATKARLRRREEGVAERCPRVENTPTAPGACDQAAAAQHGEMVGHVAGRAREEGGESRRVRRLVEHAKDARSGASDQLGERGLGIRRACEPNRPDAPGRIAEPDRAGAAEHGHDPRPDECRGHQQQPCAAEPLAVCATVADLQATPLEGDHRFQVLEHRFEPARRERMRTAENVALEDLADPLPPRRDGRLPEQFDQAGEVSDNVRGSQQPLYLGLDPVAPAQAVVDLGPRARKRRRPDRGQVRFKIGEWGSRQGHQEIGHVRAGRQEREQRSQIVFGRESFQRALLLTLPYRVPGGRNRVRNCMSRFQHLTDR